MRVGAEWMATGLLAACLGEGSGPADEPAPEIELQSITIAVSDSLSAGIVQGATVIVGGVQGATGPDGRVTLEVPTGGFSVVVFHPDYDLSQTQVGSGVRETVVLLRRSAPIVDGCQMVEGRLTALATDLAGRKTLLRHSLSNVTIEGPGFAPVVIFTTEWNWSPVDIFTARMFVTPPDTPVTRATWRVYDRTRHMVPETCTPGRVAPPDQ